MNEDFSIADRASAWLAQETAATAEEGWAHGVDVLAVAMAGDERSGPMWGELVAAWRDAANGTPTL
jgi:hypothetical protein